MTEGFVIYIKQGGKLRRNAQNKPGQHFRKVSVEDRFVQLRIIYKNIMNQLAIPHVLFGGIEKLQPLFCRRNTEPSQCRH